MPEGNALLSSALHAASRGWHVFPLRPGTKVPAGHSETACPGTGRCSEGHLKPEQRATLDTELIRRCWQRTPYGVGIATGPSGLVVVDLDVPKQDRKDAPDGATTLAALCEHHGQPRPSTYAVRTASGGQHLYFTAPDCVRLPNTAGKLGALIDTRAWGGYVVAAGASVHDGTEYTVEHDTDPVPLPEWILGQLLPKPAADVPAAPLLVSGRGSRRAQVALDREAAAVRGTSEGKRNYRLLNAARSMGRFVAWGEIPREAVEEAFQAAGEASGLTPAECRSTIRSALDWSGRTCRPREES